MGTQLYLKSGTFDPTGPSPIPSTFGRDLLAASPLQILQFRAPVTDPQRAELRAMGIELGSYVPDHAYIAKVAPTKVDALKKLPYVRALTPMQPEFKTPRGFM